MKLSDLAEALQLKGRSTPRNLDRNVLGGYTGDLLSDVIANSREGDIWVTRQIHQNIIAVASLKDLAGIILVQGNEPTPETVAKAEAEGIPVLVSDRSGFEVCGRIYSLIGKKEPSSCG